MPAIPLPLTGSCRCGGLRFRATQAPLITSACHCTGCQKMTSSAFSLSALFAAEAFEVTEGTTVAGGSGPASGHRFCPSCLTWTFTQPPGLEGYVNVRSTLFDDTGWIRPFIETFVCEKLPFAESGAERGFERFPDMDGFPALVADYSAWAG
jgi:hypothetical protein